MSSSILHVNFLFGEPMKMVLPRLLWESFVLSTSLMVRLDLPCTLTHFFLCAFNQLLFWLNGYEYY
jgi:hypothetical protein